MQVQASTIQVQTPHTCTYLHNPIFKSIETENIIIFINSLIFGQRFTNIVYVLAAAVWAKPTWISIYFSPAQAPQHVSLQPP